MTTQVAIILAAIVISWVMFVFNFVLGYYMGRAVEAAEQKTLTEKKKNGKIQKSSRADGFTKYLPSSFQYSSLS